MLVNLNQLNKLFGTVTTPAAGTKSIGLPANAQLSWFLHRHLDHFIVTQQFSPTYRDLVQSRQLHRDQWVLVRLPGLAKTTPPVRIV